MNQDFICILWEQDNEPCVSFIPIDGSIDYSTKKKKLKVAKNTRLCIKGNKAIDMFEIKYDNSDKITNNIMLVLNNKQQLFIKDVAKMYNI